MVARLNRTPPLPQLGDVPRVDNGPVQRALDAILVVLRAAVDVLQPFVQKEKWQAVTFQNSFSDYSTAVFQPTSYKKDPLGRVYLPDSSYREMTEWGASTCAGSHLAVQRPSPP